MAVTSTTSATTGQSAADYIDLLNKQNGVPAAKKTLGADDFMKLLTVQLSSQDPLKPMEDTAFIAQMASFTSLDQMRTLTKDFAAFSQNQRITDAGNYLGKNVTVIDANGQDATGIVTSVSMNGIAPTLTIGGTEYGLDAIKSVALQAPAPTSTPTETPTNSSSETANQTSTN